MHEWCFISGRFLAQLFFPLLEFRISVHFLQNMNSTESVPITPVPLLHFAVLHSPRFRGALEDINEALSRDLLETNTKMPMSERQKILYGLGGRGTYLEVPTLLHELREEADHPVEERRRIQGLHRLRRRGVQINVEDLKKRPFVRREFTGPVTTEDFEEDLTDADLHQRQSALNGWLQMQNRARVLQKQHMRHRRNVGASEPVNDDDFQVELEDLEGLGFGGRLSDVEGGEYGEQYREFLEEEGKPSENEEEAV